jgi:xyloglucan-specific exo-beta-1,4-glucanase
MAAKTGKLVKVTRTREVELQYNTVPIGPLQYSNDTGKTWQVEGYITNPPVNLNAGKVALSANGTTTLWMPEQGTTMYRHSSSNWSTVSGINFWARPIADPENDKVFYAFNKATGEMYVSSDGGISFAKSGTASPSNFGTVRAVPKKTGDIWVPVATVSESGVRSGKLMRSQDGGKTFSTISGVGYCEAVGFGKAAPNKTFPAIYVYAQIDNKLGVYQSIDEGVTWAWVNDDAHQYGGLANGEFVIGDMNTFGVVYMSTAGRGIAVRIPAEWDEYPVINKPANVVQPSHYSITRKASQLHIKTTGTPVNVRLINTKGEQLFNQNFERSSVVDLRHLNLPSGTLFIQGRAQGKVIWQNSMFWN